MNKHALFVFLAMFTMAQQVPNAAADISATNRLEFDPAIEQYVRFLENQRQSPVDYILGLFEKNDLVVLCERFHPEVTQYDLVYDLVSHPRFQTQVRHMFTELGTSALRPTLESFLLDDTLSEAQVNERLRYIAQNFDFGPVWEKTNIFDFLRKLHYLNCSLARERRVQVHPSDIEARWPAMTKEGWKEVRKQLGRRDQIMAENIISKFKELRQAKPQTKALVIMNYRHAFPHLKSQTGRRAENTTGFLLAAFPGQVANVMLNSVAPLPGTTDQRSVLGALQEGKWDAAFAAVGNPNVGFDFLSSPLGEDAFDYFPFIAHQLRYQDIFTGFVFFKPLEAHRHSLGLPGLIDDSFADELKRREAITGDASEGDISQKIKELKEAHVTVGYDQPAIFEKIQHWLKTNQNPSAFAPKLSQTNP